MKSKTKFVYSMAQLSKRMDRNVKYIEVEKNVNSICLCVVRFWNEFYLILNIYMFSQLSAAYYK